MSAPRLCAVESSCLVWRRWDFSLPYGFVDHHPDCNPNLHWSGRAVPGRFFSGFIPKNEYGGRRIVDSRGGNLVILSYFKVLPRGTFYPPCRYYHDFRSLYRNSGSSAFREAGDGERFSTSDRVRSGVRDLVFCFAGLVAVVRFQCRDRGISLVAGLLRRVVFDADVPDQALGWIRANRAGGRRPR